MPDWLSTVVAQSHENLLLKKHTIPLQMMQKRGVTKQDIFDHRIGFVDDGLMIQECAEDFIPWSQQFLHQAITFPMYSMLGEEIGLQIRLVEEQSYQRPYKQYYAYHRDIFPYFFGLPQALPHIYSTGYLVICEGIFDYFAIKRVTPNVLAVLTSGVPVACRRFFKRFTKLVVAMLDMDEPGHEGALRLARDADGYLVHIPSYTEKDPGALFERNKLHEIERIVSSTSKLLVR